MNFEIIELVMFKFCQNLSNTLNQKRISQRARWEFENGGASYSRVVVSTGSTVSIEPVDF